MELSPKSQYRKLKESSKLHEHLQTSCFKGIHYPRSKNTKICQWTWSLASSIQFTHHIPTNIVYIWSSPACYMIKSNFSHYPAHLSLRSHFLLSSFQLHSIHILSNSINDKILNQHLSRNSECQISPVTCSWKREVIEGQTWPLNRTLYAT